MDNIAVAKCFVKATVNVLSTMASVMPIAGKPFVKKDVIPLGEVTAIVAVNGYKNGSIAVSFSKSAAIFLVQAMVGGNFEITVVEIKDIVGEICNMVSGQARALLAAEGVVIHGEIPKVFFGKNYKVEHSIDAPVIAIPFELKGKSFCTIEFCIE